ncbi:hypothetical protein EVAR_61555_1 [Eumeta japonica]|uniref:Uncharacterized protein n=1 Tax=Eumeta variegata TaxID=151549 RepID=A0A4C1Z8X4_EUMVA|nr:hypothetical protein EVAR_61555_1 [Eumeta japonica]
MWLNCSRVIVWRTWLQHKNRPGRPVKYNTLTDYEREIAASMSESSGGLLSFHHTTFFSSDPPPQCAIPFHEAGNAQITPPGLRVSMGQGLHARPTDRWSYLCVAPPVVVQRAAHVVHGVGVPALAARASVRLTRFVAAANKANNYKKILRIHLTKSLFSN